MTGQWGKMTKFGGAAGTGIAILVAVGSACSSTPRQLGARPAAAPARLPSSEGDASSEPASIRQFFENYGLIADSFEHFRAAQAKLLAPGLQTTVRDHHGETPYEGPDGYFASLGPWGEVFSTEADFGTQFLGQEADGTYHVRMTGTLKFKGNGRDVTIKPEQNRWEEIFRLDARGRIVNLQVNMNLPPEALR